MDKLKTLLNWYKGLGKRSKILIGFAVVVLTLALLDCISGVLS